MKPCPSALWGVLACTAEGLQILPNTQHYGFNSFAVKKIKLQCSIVDDNLKIASFFPFFTKMLLLKKCSITLLTTISTSLVQPMQLLENMLLTILQAIRLGHSIDLPEQCNKTGGQSQAISDHVPLLLVALVSVHQCFVHPMLILEFMFSVPHLLPCQFTECHQGADTARHNGGIYSRDTDHPEMEACGDRR